jgi:hypothetical protein
MKQKSDFIKSCKDLMEMIQEADRDMQADIRSVFREGEEIIESERRTFKQGYDERLAKFMAQKAQQYRESTNRAMDPEFKRLQTLHEHDMTRLRLDLENEERRLQDSIKQRLESLKEEEKKATKEEIRFILKAIQDKCAKELEDLAQEFKQKSRTIRVEYDRQLDRHQRQLKDKLARMRKDCHQELDDVHHQGQERLLSMKQKHIEMMQKMAKDHEQKIRLLRRDADDEKFRLEQQFYQPQQSQSSEKVSGNGKASPERQTKRPLYRPVAGFDDDDDMDAVVSPSRRKQSNAKDVTTARNASITPVQREELSRIREEQETNRDQQLQSLIRSLEIETMKLEREWKQRIEKEEMKISELTSKEHEQLSRRLRQINDETADFVVEREQLHRALQDEKQKEEQYQSEIQQLRKEIVVYEDGIAAQRSRLQEKTQQHQLALRGLQLEYTPQFRDVQHQIDQLQNQMTVYAQRWEDDQQLLESEHAGTLAGLDRQVKEDVSQLDVEIMQLKEELEEEKVKQQRFQVHLARYGGRDSHPQSNDKDDMVGNNDYEEVDDEELHITKRRVSTNGNTASSRVTTSQNNQHLPRQYQQEDADRQARLNRVGAALAAVTGSTDRRSSSANRIRANTSSGTSTHSAGSSSVRSRIVNRRANNEHSNRQNDRVHHDHAQAEEDGQQSVYTARSTTTQRTASTASYTVAGHNEMRSQSANGTNPSKQLRSSTGGMVFSRK